MQVMMISERRGSLRRELVGSAVSTTSDDQLK